MSKLIFDLLSDTHNQHSRFKCAGGDFLLHSGDQCGRGTLPEALAFLDWYADQDYSHLIIIPGNHDWCYERQPELLKEECEKRGIILLNDSGYEAEGVKIWGSPVQPWFHSWAFNRARTQKEATRLHGWIKPHWDMIPPNTEVLLTHGPPYGIGDEVVRPGGDSYNPPQLVGCEELLNRIKETQVKLHVSGHIHEGRGIIFKDGVNYVNASSLDRMYCPVAKKPIRAIREILPDGSILYSIEE